jgi:hypothetical protein
VPLFSISVVLVAPDIVVPSIFLISPVESVVVPAAIVITEHSGDPIQ